MSYVLDALRRAEAERQRGVVPGVHAQNVPEPGAAAPASTAWPAWAWLGGGIALVAAAGVAWWLAAPGGADPQPASAEAPVAAPVARPAPQVRAAEPLPMREGPTPPRVIAAPVPPPPTSTAPATPARVPRLQTLPESFRRQLPPLNFGGATDSPVAGARMLIVNGQVFREGEEPAPGLRLERITLRGAEFSFRGQRFEVAY